jgi:hypothetical protein
MDNNDTRDKLREELVRVQMEGIKISIEQLRIRMHERIDAIQTAQSEHEKRLRLVEEVAVKFNFIIYLTMGGGLIGLINLAYLIFGK